MKGTIVATWLKTCRKLYDDDVVSRAMNSVGWKDSKIFSPAENIDDNQVKKVIGFIADDEGIPINQLWTNIGRDNIKSFFNDFPAFFQHENLYSFLRSMYDVHIEMVKKFPGAKPPLVNLKPISSRKAIFSYDSKREMFDYALGLIEGSAEFFNEKLEIKEIERGTGKLKLEFTFEEDIYYKKIYRFNKALSLGFIKSIPAKVGMFTLIISVLVNIPLIGFESILKFIVASMLPASVSAFAVGMLIKPKSLIEAEIRKINANDYTEEGKIVTGDFFEDIYDLLKEHRKVVRADFTSFKGVTDEMNTFVRNINTISDTMSRTSEEISGVVEQVANGAVSQAENTQNAASTLNKNIESLKTIVDNENDNKEELEKAIEKINNSYSNVENSSKNIIKTLQKFQEVKDQGIQLENKAKNITNIVSIVSQISEQTNLLALNASIEAARAGEAGRGFSVVAEEVRKLAEQTQGAVEEINSNLGQFVNEIKVLVEKIGLQYDVLENETTNLEKVRNISLDATNSAQTVSASMIETINELDREAHFISKIYDNIESLSAIAEENSASSEEVSANVSNYTNEIKNLIDNIFEFKKLTEEFKTELSKYKI
ncbi:heme NO-binding domain-containing protein [Clostridium ganghwense]|uniref:Heme NO-binding domain-containing protein n=1 Tax=Clostridium ganghwense TaxID=312089 RepID=A0ABT4CSE9_9CLOT|nr:heme NO-binding domain-containing protein [Clostridium ganghwense]MCY6371993.1 heme NO-binding domain-containing protein [Clostridium ganghwense]